MSQATFTSSTFSAGDTVYFSGLGAANYTIITIPSSGASSSSLITYQGLADGMGTGDYPIISVASGRSINTNSQSYITVSGFDVEYAGSLDGGIHVYVPGTVSYVTLSNLTINGHGYGFGIDVAGSASNITLSSITISNITYYSVWFPGAVNSAVSISNLTTSSGRGMSILNTNGLTLTNVTSNATISAYYDSLGLNMCSGDIVISNYHSTGSGAVGLNIITSTPSSLLITNPVIVSAAGGKGLFLQNVNSPSIQILNGSIHDNSGTGIFIDQAPGTIIKGFNPYNIANGGIYNNGGTANKFSGISVGNTSGNSDNMVIEDNWIYSNGYPDTYPAWGNCDGIDIHANSSNGIIRNNIIVRNGHAGLALVLNSNGVVYNNVIAYNGTVGVTDRGGYYNSGSGSWTFNNNILMNNYPYEYNVNNSVLPPVTLSNNNIFFHDRDSNPIFHNTSGNPSYTLAQWQAAFNQDLNSLNTNPLFVNASGNYSQVTDFQLLSTSPAIDSGTSTGMPTMDYAGNTRRDDFLVANTGGGTLPYYDIGAYEYVAPLAIVPSAPTLSASTTSSINIVVNANGNVDTAEYAIENVTNSQWVQADGALGASEVWQNRVAWGGDLGIANTGLLVNTSYDYKVKARNAEHIETALSGSATTTGAAATIGTTTTTGATAATGTTATTTGSTAVVATPALPATGNGANDNSTFEYILLSFLAVSLSTILVAVVMKRKAMLVR